MSHELPYKDIKPTGASDFYFAINAMFAFILRTRGESGLLRYWKDLGTNYYAPVSQIWKEGGLPAVAGYWRSFFAAEPGAAVDVTMADDQVVVTVNECPAIKHLRAHGRPIVPCFCRHCYFVSEAIAEPAGMTVRIDGGNGACRQVFSRRTSANRPQDLDRIRSAQ